MNIQSHTRHLLVSLFIVTLSACTSGSGGGDSKNNTNPSNPVFSFDAFIPHAVVTLDRQTGTLKAGSIVPLACISGGNVAGADACSDDHLHGFIDISGIGSGFTDPVPGVCGHGKVGISIAGLLSHTCDELDKAQLAIIADDLSPYSNVFLSVIENGVGEIQHGDIKSQLREGLNPVQESIGSNFVAGVVMTRCDRGINPDTGQREIQHTKTTVDYSAGNQIQFKLPKCKLFSNYAAGGVDVDLESNGGFGGVLYTGRGSSAVKPLLDGNTNPFSFDVPSSSTERTGMVISYTSPRFRGFAINYNPQAGETIVADSSKLQPTDDVVFDDDDYLLLGDYTGIKARGLGLGLSVDYAELNNAVGIRKLPKINGLAALDGMYAYSAEFESTDAITGDSVGISIRKYNLLDLSIQYTEDKPPYIESDDFTLTDVPGEGFDMTMSYSLGAGLIDFNVYKVDVRAETLENDGVTDVLHSWRINNYRWGATGNTEGTWPSGYLNANGDTPPTAADVTRLKYYATDDDALTRRDLYRDRPYDEIDKTTRIQLNYNF